jgi:hypothetical protein
MYLCRKNVPFVEKMCLCRKNVPVSASSPQTGQFEVSACIKEQEVNTNRATHPFKRLDLYILAKYFFVAALDYSHAFHVG